MSARAWRRRRYAKSVTLELKRALAAVRADPTVTYRLAPPLEGLVVISLERYHELTRVAGRFVEVAKNEAGILFTPGDVS